MLYTLDFDISKTKKTISFAGHNPQTPCFRDILLALALSQVVTSKTRFLCRIEDS